MYLNTKCVAFAGLFLCGGLLPMKADIVDMQTAKTTGQTISLTLNVGVKATLEWDNGETENVTFAGDFVEIPVQGKTLRITTESPITELYCAGNELTSLNVKAAAGLQTLICHDNKLIMLDCSNNKKLVQLNCQRNEIASINVRECSSLRLLNCAQNPLKLINLGADLSELKTFICADCSLTRLTLTYQARLEHLWCQNNQITTLDVHRNTQLKDICAFGNGLTSINVSGLTQLEELYVDDNQLKTLDLSDCEQLVTVSIDNNLLNHTDWAYASKNTLKYYYAKDNQLAFNSFPEIYQNRGGGRYVLDKFTLSPQRPIELVSAISVGEQIDLSGWINKSGVNPLLTPNVVWKKVSDGTELQIGKDYKLVSKGIYEFLLPVGDVYAEVTVTSYPNFVLSTTAVKVMTDTTPVEQVETDGLVISSCVRTLMVSSVKNCHLLVVTPDGRQVINTTIIGGAGMHRWTLPAGMYIVNGRKLIIGQ